MRHNGILNMQTAAVELKLWWCLILFLMHRPGANSDLKARF